MRPTCPIPILPLLAAILLSGCTTRIIDFTAISSKNCDIPGQRGARVRGKDTAHIILFIPTGVPNIKEAVDEALEKGGGDVLVDGVVYQKMWWALLYGQSSFEVEGTIVKTR